MLLEFKMSRATNKFQVLNLQWFMLPRFLQWTVNRRSITNLHTTNKWPPHRPLTFPPAKPLIVPPWFPSPSRFRGLHRRHLHLADYRAGNYIPRGTVLCPCLSTIPHHHREAPHRQKAPAHPSLQHEYHFGRCWWLAGLQGCVRPAPSARQYEVREAVWPCPRIVAARAENGTSGVFVLPTGDLSVHL